MSGALFMQRSVSPLGADAGGILYQLNAGSSYQEGCFPPCMCPIMWNLTLQGTFVLTPVTGSGQYGQFEVSDVQWSYQRGQQVVTVTGTGVYTLSPDVHRLELDLVAGGDPPRHFDSGLVAAPGNFPEIDVAVAANGFFCYDHAFAVSARAGAVPSETAAWGVLKAAFR